MSAPVVLVGELDPLDRHYLEHSAAHTLLAECVTTEALRAALEAAPEPVNLVVLSHYHAVVPLLEDRTRFRAGVARLFLIGGKSAPFLPVDPRLQEQVPAAYPSDLDPDLARLLVSGEGVIWLPGDVCLWRHWDEAGQSATLLSALPAFCLAALPEPLPWMRLFRAVPVRVAVGADGTLSNLASPSDHPNCFVVVAIDGAALSRFLRAAHPG